MKTCSGLWSVLLNCGLCELKLGWILPARERNRQGLCLTWSLAHLCSIHMYGAMLILHRQACMQRPGQSWGEWQGPWLALGGSVCVDVDFISGVRRLLFHVVNPADTNGLLNQSSSFPVHVHFAMSSTYKYINIYFNKFNIFLSWFIFIIPPVLIFFLFLQLSSIVVSLMSISITLMSLPVPSLLLQNRILVHKL